MLSGEVQWKNSRKARISPSGPYLATQIKTTLTFTLARFAFHNLHIIQVPPKRLTKVLDLLLIISSLLCLYLPNLMPIQTD